jgi:hypothetical protein
MVKKLTKAQQDAAYEYGYRSRKNNPNAEYFNPFDINGYYLLFTAFKQGWNDRVKWEKKLLDETN